MAKSEGRVAAEVRGPIFPKASPGLFRLLTSAATLTGNMAAWADLPRGSQTMADDAKPRFRPRYCTLTSPPP